LMIISISPLSPDESHRILESVRLWPGSFAAI
jgi:hypothetical protein